MEVKQIKIDFQVTPQVKRFVYVYLIEMADSCILVDSGVSGSENQIERAIMESGHQPGELKKIFLTHAHPDHIGTAHYFQEKYGVKIYASEGERPWIEDIDLQFRERPIPNFYHLAGHSAIVDKIVKDGDIVSVSDELKVEVVGTAGHCADEVSYRIGNMLFIGDAVPVKGDIPIWVDVEKTRQSLEVLKNIEGVDYFYPAWEQTYSLEDMRKKLVEAENLINSLEKCIELAGKNLELQELVDLVCEKMNAPMWKANPLFVRTVDSFRR